ncbi:MAG: hypothetical protein CMM93_07310, partial [Rickettsiales bacterium]|nr:hypothetical protein [Rickettsiales bacterium]
IGLSPTLIESASISAQIARIKTFEAVRDFFSGSAFLSFLEAPFMLLAVAAVAFIAGPLVFVPLAMLAGYLCLFLWARSRIRVTIRLAAKASSARQQFTIESFEKLSVIRGHGLADKWQEKFRHLSGREMMVHFQLGWLGMVTESLAHALTVLAVVATVGFGVHLIWAGVMSSGALVASMILVWRILTPFYSLCTMVPRLEQLRNSVQQVNQLMDIETEAEQARSFSQLPSLKGAISFHRVCLRYGEEGDVVFDDLTFEAKPGDLIAITGGNGTGKASVLKLIKILSRPSDGIIRIDDFDVRQLDAPALRRQIAYVPKTPHFFHGSIAQNLRYANPMASETDIQNALELADADQEIMALPQGLDTIIGMHDAHQLTSSLATRLSLARAYLQPSAILLIDELPNSLLSDKAGRNLKEYLARSKGRRTILLCTYREDFMKLADSIVWLRGAERPVVGSRDTILTSLQEHMELAA